MTRALAWAGLCGLGDEPGAWIDGLRAGAPRPEAVEPRCPRRVERDLWRRMGRVERMAVAVASPLLARAVGARVGLVWGSAIGALPASRVFRRSLDALGPDGASPSAFQVSVHNAPAGFIAMAAGVTGPAEAVFAGGATGAVALLTAQDMLADEDLDLVLAIVGDARSRDSLLACRLAGLPEPGDAVAGVLLARGEGPGVPISWVSAPLRPDLARRRALPGEAASGLLPALAPDDALGLVPAPGLWSVVALAASGGGVVVDWTGDVRFGVRVG